MQTPSSRSNLYSQEGQGWQAAATPLIAMARAILEDPPILILDEATSALDADSEHAISLELDRLSGNRTTLIIAHRLTRIVIADAIVVMERGRIVERGTHAQLLQQEGAYARLRLLQRRMDKDMAG